MSNLESLKQKYGVNLGKLEIKYDIQDLLTKRKRGPIIQHAMEIDDLMSPSIFLLIEMKNIQHLGRNFRPHWSSLEQAAIYILCSKRNIPGELPFCPLSANY